MGGKKRVSLKQMERMQSRQEAEKGKEKKKEKTSASKEKRPISVIAPDIKDDAIVTEIKKMKVLTPYAVASRFNIRISAAKDFLAQLEAAGTVQLVSGNHTLKIYKPVTN